MSWFPGTTITSVFLHPIVSVSRSSHCAARSYSPFFPEESDVARDEHAVHFIDSGFRLDGFHVRNEALLDIVVNIDLRTPFLAEVDIGHMYIR